LGEFGEDGQTKISTLLHAMETAAKEGNKQKQGEIKDELKEIARNHTPIMQEAKEMLLKWEQGDKEVLELWQRMNSWVYAGFGETYKRIGSDFDKIYYESNTYLLGKI
jgi:arginyl-tRNA synthetase